MIESKDDTHSSPLNLQAVQHILETTPDIIYRYRVVPPRGFEYLNPAITAITGHTPEEHYKNPDLGLNLILPLGLNLTDELVHKNPENEPVIIHFVCQNGEVIWTEHCSVAVTDEHGNIIAIEGIARNISHRKSSVESLSKSESGLIPFLFSSSEDFSKTTDLRHLGQMIGTGLKELSHADQCAIINFPEDADPYPIWLNGFQESDVPEIILYVQSLLESRNINKLTLYLIPERDIHAFSSIAIRNKNSHTVIIAPFAYEKHLLAVGFCSHHQPCLLKEHEKAAIEAFCYQSAIVLENNRLGSELEEAYLESILALAKAIDARDTYTSDHSQQLVLWAEMVARRLQCSEKEIEAICWAALLHDIGKIGIPDEILHKPSTLTDEEWCRMKQHPEIGANIVSNIKKLKTAIPLIRHHHEHFDGSGYPAGLSGEQIPLGARILSVVDAYGAMIDRRVYRPAREPEEAVSELRRKAGKQFDPQVVNAFLSFQPS
ncbi:HD domain-containing phosphohydrolase [Ornatilinea apprima]|uniref:HD domain-containing phosphohydrolase n=1 Tax=Ornatilinea apprima TaxID=1134406 RepID=UPI000946542D|nr:HD domain-containing phosphohydrolase [Ornatilinea apprima]